MKVTAMSILKSSKDDWCTMFCRRLWGKPSSPTSQTCGASASCCGRSTPSAACPTPASPSETSSSTSRTATRWRRPRDVPLKSSPSWRMWDIFIFSSSTFSINQIFFETNKIFFAGVESFPREEAEFRECSGQSREVQDPEPAVIAVRWWHQDYIPLSIQHKMPKPVIIILKCSEIVLTSDSNSGLSCGETCSHSKSSAEIVS